VKKQRTRAVIEVTDAHEICQKTSTSTCLVFNVTLDMMAPINSKKQQKIKEEKYEKMHKVKLLSFILYFILQQKYTEILRMFTE